MRPRSGNFPSGPIFFMEKQVMEEFVCIFRVSRTVTVSVQLLQTILDKSINPLISKIWQMAAATLFCPVKAFISSSLVKPLRSHLKIGDLSTKLQKLRLLSVIIFPPKTYCITS
ncbi:hypothetical protein AALP_AA2G090600 [Arabis alpina]|uniref:Uncharacterized protein n=1 Tax=Arabis alpina TaxID=50452 RepID=A0A087HG84_ARAAL|nr:hypothetical protein AALP_AA2G090600 [Arabis alpina]